MSQSDISQIAGAILGSVIALAITVIIRMVRSFEE